MPANYETVLPAYGVQTLYGMPESYGPPLSLANPSVQLANGVSFWDIRTSSGFTPKQIAIGAGAAIMIFVILAVTQRR
jgi:hypothetical protein